MVTITDSRKYRSIVTDTGKKKIAIAALAGEKVNITQAAVGDANGQYYAPAADMTNIVHEVWRGEIANKQINPESPNMIDVKVILPADVGGFTAREVGFFDSDGDLIAVCNMPPTEKVVITTGAAGTLTIVSHIVFTDVDAVEFQINPVLDSVTVSEMEKYLEEHNKDSDAHKTLRTDLTNYVDQTMTDKVAEIIQAVGTSSAAVTQLDITIPTTGWVADTDTAGKYALHRDIALSEVTEELIPILTLLPSAGDTAKACGMCNAARTLDGVLRVYAAREPTADMPCSLTLVVIGGGGSGSGGAGGSGAGYTLPAASSTRLGGVKVGNGLNVQDDGTISVNAAEVLEGQTATDADVNEMLEEVFNGSTAK